jgi:hypothetical protein
VKKLRKNYLEHVLKKKYAIIVFKKKRFFEYLNINLKSTFLWLDQVQREKTLLFRIQHQSFRYKNANNIL